MINAGPAQALAEVAARASEMLHAYEPGYETTDDQVRSATLARSKPSTDPLSAAAPEGAYFVGSDASGKTFYSRDGSFKIDGSSVTWPDGSAVLGYAKDAPPGAAPRPLRIGAVDAALGRTGDARVGSDGSISYSRTVVDPKSGKSTVETVTVGRIALARFTAATALVRVSANRVAPPADVQVTLGRAGEGPFGQIAPRARDVGSVDFEAGLNQLREAFLALDAMSASDRVADRDVHVAMDLIK